MEGVDPLEVAVAEEVVMEETEVPVHLGEEEGVAVDPP